MVKKRKIAAIPPRAKRVVVLDRWDRFKGEYMSITEAGVLDPTDQVLHYQLQNTKAYQGYRYDRVLDLVSECTRGEGSFGGILATLIFIDLHWNEMEAGEDESGLYVSWGSRRFYQSGRFENDRSVVGVTDGDEGVIAGDIAMENWYTACKVNGMILYVHVPTIMYVLYHNTSGVHPIAQPGYGYSKPGGTFGWKKQSTHSPEHLALINSLRYYNLLTEGVPSYMWIVSNADLTDVHFEPRRDSLA